MVAPLPGKEASGFLSLDPSQFVVGLPEVVRLLKTTAAQDSLGIDSMSEKVAAVAGKMITVVVVKLPGWAEEIAEAYETFAAMTENFLVV